MKWLLKTEPEEYSIDDLGREKKTLWTGVRNYQARNYLREMSVGETVLIYHSQADPSGVVGVGRVTQAAFVDPTQFDRRSDLFDPRATKEEPRWFAPEIGLIKKFKKPVSIEELRSHRTLSGMQLLKRGNRLSVMPLDDREFELILKLGQ